MISKNIVLNNEVGLHARPAALFVQTANKFSSNIYVEFKGKKVSGKSIIGVMSLGAFSGEEITITANGVDEEKAIKELIEVVENKLKDL